MSYANYLFYKHYLRVQLEKAGLERMVQLDLEGGAAAIMSGMVIKVQIGAYQAARIVTDYAMETHRFPLAFLGANLDQMLATANRDAKLYFPLPLIK